MEGTMPVKRRENQKKCYQYYYYLCQMPINIEIFFHKLCNVPQYKQAFPNIFTYI